MEDEGVSARASRDWYYKARFILGEAVTDHRLSLTSEIIRLLLTMVPQQRGQHLRKPTEEYAANASPKLMPLLTNISFSE